MSATIGFAKTLQQAVGQQNLTRCITLVFAVWIFISILNISFLNFAGLNLVYLYAISGNIALLIQFIKKSFSRPSFYEVGLYSFLMLWFLVTTWLYFQFPDLNCDDDLTVYLRHLKMFLQTGALDDPFSYRRLASYSGQTFLTALFVGPLPTYLATVFEIGIVNPLIVSLIYEESKKKMSVGKSLVLALSFLLVPQFRLNIAAQSTAIYLSLASILFLNDLFVKPNRKNFWFLVISLFALLSLRNNLILPFLALLGLGFYFLNQYKKSFALDGFAITALMGLYVYSTYRSSNTVFFPFYSANFNFDYGLFQNDYSARFFKPYFIESLACTDLLAVLFCLLYLVSNIKRNGILILIGCLDIVFILSTTYFLRALLMPWQVQRYTEGLNISFIFLTFMSFLSDQKVRVLARSSLAVAAIIVFSNTPVYLTTFLTQNFSSTALYTGFLNRQLAREDFYKSLLSQFTPGSRLISMVNDPYLFDYSRHQIENLEIIGLASPNNQFNALGQFDEIDQYLKSLSAQAFLFQDLKTTTCHYAPELYQSLLDAQIYRSVNNRYQLKQESIPLMLPSVISYTPYFVNFFDYLKHIEKASPQTNNIHVYDLRAGPQQN